MAIPLSPAVSVSPSTVSSSGTTVTAAVSLYNRPAYHGKPKITGLTTITPKIKVSCSTTGVAPYAILVSADETTHDGENPSNAVQDLHYTWDFGDTDGTHTVTDWWNGQTVNLNNCQRGPQANYVYETAGTYTIRLTVRGKDENGTLVTASTTTLYSYGLHWVYKGAATAGTYTLSFNGDTTAALPYTSTAEEEVAALQLLPSLSTANVRATYYGSIEFFGNLIGGGYTFTADFSGLTGTVYPPFIRDESQEGVSPGMVITATSTLTTQYFDSTYAGGAGASDGTSTRPWTTSAQLETFLEANTGDKCASIARGSDFTLSSRIKFELANHNTIRVIAHGSGAKPILRITSTTAGFNFELTRGTASSPIRTMGDFVFCDLGVITTVAAKCFSVVASNNGTAGYPYGHLSGLCLCRCEWSTTTLGDTSFLHGIVSANDDGTRWNNILIWQCDIDGGGSNQVALIHGRIDRWLGITGGSIQGGIGGLTFDHHVYCTVTNHYWIQYVEFGAGEKSFCVNGNAFDGGGAHLNFGIDGCNVTGTQNGIDMSNTSNTWASGADSGHFHQWVIQFNKIHSGQISDQQFGILSYNNREGTVRSNLFWDNGTSNIAFANTANYPWQPKMWCYDNKFSGGQISVRGTQAHYFHNNVHQATVGSTGGTVGGIPYCLRFYNTAAEEIDQWDADGNTFHNDNTTNPFYDDTAGAEITFATWQAAGNDAAGQVADPLFASGDTGVFVATPEAKIDWPSGFTSLEYSLDGSSWSAYTDDTYVEIAATLPAQTTIYFRAAAPGENGVYTLTASTRAASLDTAVETATGTVTAAGLVQYLTIQVGSTFAVLTQESA